MLTIAIIEDLPAIREGLAFLIDSTPEFQCVGRYRSMEEALTGIAHRTPDVALVDIAGMSGSWDPDPKQRHGSILRSYHGVR
jgi:DNA-binding NarL/FixJ family response regulator